MGKFCKTLKSQVTNNNSYSPNHNKRKIRASVLAVFKKHFRTEDNSEREEFNCIIPSKSTPAQTYKEYTSSNETGSSTSMPSQEDIVRRKRRRKSKAERNKTRSKSLTNKCDINGKSDMNKHIRTAHDVSYPLRSKKSAENEESHNHITHNRLTKRLGLFNKVKKSDTISRKIALTESLKKQTEDDLKKILNIHDDDDGSNIPMDVDEPAASASNASCGSKSSKHPPAILYEPQSSKTTTPASAKLGNGPAHIFSASTCVSTCPSSTEVEFFPLSPPIDDIVQRLAERLEEHRIFKGIDIASDLCDDLRRQMKHSTARNVTPSSTKLKSCVSSSSSVCRSLIDSYMPDEKENTPLLVERKHHSFSTKRRAAQQIPDNTAANQAECSKIHLQAHPVHINDQFSISKVPTRLDSDVPPAIRDLVLRTQEQNFKAGGSQETMNAMDIIRSNDAVTLRSERNCPATTTLQVTNSLHDALDLLARNDKMLETRQQLDTKSGSERRFVFPDYKSHSSQEMNSQSSGFHSDVTSHRNPILETFLQRTEPQSSIDRASSKMDEHQAVLTEYCEDGQYMPRFHGDFYKDSLWFEKTILSHIEQDTAPSSHQPSTLESKAHSMDILDILDHNGQASSHFPHSGHSSKMSPDWPQLSQPYLIPPRQDSPDSPQMFPRRLY